MKPAPLPSAYELHVCAARLHRVLERDGLLNAPIDQIKERGSIMAAREMRGLAAALEGEVKGLVKDITGEGLGVLDDVKSSRGTIQKVRTFRRELREATAAVEGVVNKLTNGPFEDSEGSQEKSTEQPKAQEHKMTKAEAPVPGAVAGTSVGQLQNKPPPGVTLNPDAPAPQPQPPDGNGVRPPAAA